MVVYPSMSLMHIASNVTRIATPKRKGYTAGRTYVSYREVKETPGDKIYHEQGGRKGYKYAGCMH